MTVLAQAGCGFFDVSCKVNDVVKDAAANVLEELASAVVDAVEKVVFATGTAWVWLATPNLTTSDGVAPSGPVAYVQNSLWWYMAAFTVLSVIIGGAKMAWEQRAEPGRELLKSLLTLVVVSGCGLAALSLAVGASDEFSRWILRHARDGTDFRENLGDMLGLSLATFSLIGPLLLILLGLIALVVSFVQIMLMVARGAMLVLMAGVLPTAASMTNTEMGRAWFDRFVAWTLAFVLYKPAAAIIYATGFQLLGSDLDSEGGVLHVLIGIVVMMLAILALPALMQLLVPAVSAVSRGGHGGAGSMELLAMAPTGALAVGAMRSSPGGAADPPGSGSTGGPGGSGPGGGGPAGAGGDDPPPSPASEGGGSPGASESAPAGGSPAAGGATAGTAGAAAAVPAAGAVVAGAEAVGSATETVQRAADSAAGAEQPAEGPDGSR